jgi:hypothetical protein
MATPVLGWLEKQYSHYSGKNMRFKGYSSWNRAVGKISDYYFSPRRREGREETFFFSSLSPAPKYGGRNFAVNISEGSISEKS